MEETEGQGGGRAEEAEREAGQEERDPCRTGKETCTTEERGGRKIKERGS